MTHHYILISTEVVAAVAVSASATAACCYKQHMPFVPYHKFEAEAKSFNGHKKKHTQGWRNDSEKKEDKFHTFFKVKIQAKNIYHETKLVFRVCARLYFGTYTTTDVKCVLRKDTNGCSPYSLYACFKSLHSTQTNTRTRLTLFT